ncbi:MAG: hypothetical protein FIA96_11155 [Betaproteobacteria bacterium]|nr:hypothetical protein [Betaproteobacteria bacterium]
MASVAHAATPGTEGQRTENSFTLSSGQFAALNQVKDQTVRKRFCITGSYFGVRPRKLANGRLVWPAVQISLDSI